MARIVCQVLHRKDRITFIWSDGSDTFPPYHLEGDERASLLRIADQIHPRLAGAGPAELAQLGYQLYKSLFRVEAGPHAGSATEARQWLFGLMKGDAIESLEFLTDSPGRIPWSVLIEEIPATTDTAQRFWGARFVLAAGRRVNPLRQNPVQAFPTLKWLIDPDCTIELSEAMNVSFNEPRLAGLLIESTESAQARLGKQAPDIVVVLARFAGGSFSLGGQPFHGDDFANWLEASSEGNPDPLVILLGVGDTNEQTAWRTTIEQMSAKLNGLVVSETLLSAGKAFEAAQAVVKRFVEGARPIGEILRSLRSEQGGTSLALTACCPPQLRVASEGSAMFDPASASTPRPLPAQPYRPFAAYDVGDRALFFGREAEAVRGALLTDRADTVGVFLHGAPAVGKTSYLQAGLLPTLEMDSVGYRVLRDRTPTGDATPESAHPWLILRCTSDLAGQLADGLASFCAQPYIYGTPAGQSVTVDLPRILREAVTNHLPPRSTAIQATPENDGSVPSHPVAALNDDAEPDVLNIPDLWNALRENTTLLGQALDAVTRSLPFELVIAIDQGEDLVTQVRKPHQDQRRQQALAMLDGLSQSAARCKFVYTLRTQSLGRLLELFPAGHASPAWQSFFLRPLTDGEMGEALLWPTNRDDVPFANQAPFQKYRFAFDPGAAQQIATDVAAHARNNYLSPLPILQALGAVLYENVVIAKKQGTLRIADVKSVGGIGESLSKAFDAKLNRLSLSTSEKTAMRDLLLKLCTSNADGTLDRDLLPASALASLWKAAGRPVAEIVNRAAEEQGLFEIQNLWIQGKQELIVSLAQDSLAQLARKNEEAKAVNLSARGKMIESWWIVIPLAFLTSVLVILYVLPYFGFLTPGQSSDVETKKKLEDLAEAFKESQTRNEEQAAGARRPAYLGLIAQTEQAIQAENALRARQLLLSQPAQRSFREGGGRTRLPDLRSFEWKHLWKRINGEQLLLAGQGGPVLAVAITPDGKRAATTSNDGVSHVWNLEARERLAEIKGPKSAMNAIALSPDGKTLGIAGADKNVSIYDLTNLKTDFVNIDKATKILEGHTDAINGLAFGKEATTLASAGQDGTVILWDIAVGKPKQTLKDHGAPVRALAFDADGKTLTSADVTGQLIVWDGQAGTKRHAFKTAYQTIHGLAIGADGKTIATAGVESKLGRYLGMVRFWAVADGKETQSAITHGAGALAVALSANGKTVVTGGTDHIIRVWDAESAKEKHHYLGHLGGVLSLALAGDGVTLVTGSFDQSAKVWNIEHPAGVQVLSAHADGVECLTLDRGRYMLASAGKDGIVKLWDAKTGKELATLKAAGAAITSLAFSSHTEKHLLAAGTRDEAGKGAIKIWQLELSKKDGWQATEKHTLSEHTKAVTCVAFHPDADKASLLLSGSDDHTVKLWDAEAGKEKETYRGHKDTVRSVEFTFDGKTFASSGKDGLVCLGEIGGKEIRTVADLHNGGIEALITFEFKMGDIDHPVTGLGLVTAGTEQMIRVAVVDQMERLPMLKAKSASFIRAHAQPIRSLAFSPDRRGGGLLATAADDGAVKVLDPVGERFTLIGHRGPVRGVVIAGDQSFIASAGSDGTIRIWRAADIRTDR